MASICKRLRKDGTPRYVVRFTDHRGKKTEKPAGSTKKAAELLKVRIERELAEGSYGRDETEVPTFGEFCAKFLAFKGGQIKDSTLADYTRVIENHLKPYLGKYVLSDIRPVQIQEFMAHLEEKGLSPATRGKIFRYLKSMLRSAISLEIIDKDPTYALRGPRVEKEEMQFLEPEEVALLLNHADKDMKALLAVACYAGLRQGEILGLKWNDIDFNKRTINVTRTYHYAHGFTSPKTRSSIRVVPMAPTLQAMLEEHYGNAESSDECSLVFPNRDGNAQDRRNLTRRAFERTLKGAGIRRVRFHDLRHTFAALCIEGGTDIKTLQALMGHSSIKVTMDVYGHLYRSSFERAIEGLETVIARAR